MNSLGPDFDDLLDGYDPVPSLVARGVMSDPDLLDDPAEEAAYLAHVDAEHAAHDCDEVHGPHDCTLEEPEESHSYPTKGGDITVTVACPACGNVLHTYRDSIL